jgi:hypothetical protein
LAALVTEKDWVWDGFRVTLAGEIVCACEAAAIKKRIAAAGSLYVFRMIFWRLTINRKIASTSLCPVLPNRSVVYT